MDPSIASSTDERLLRVKRGTRKGNIKKIRNYYHLVVNKPLSQLKVADLQRKLDALDENVMVFEAIQDRLDIICDSEALAEEEKDIDTLRIQQDELRSGLCDLIKAKEAFHMARTIQHIVKDLEAAETLTGRMVKESIRDMTRQLTQFRTAVDSLPDSEELGAMLEDIVPQVRRIIRKHDEEYAEVESHTGNGSATSTITATLGPQLRSHSNLRLNLPSFSGDLLDWKDFWRVFSSIIDKETSLSDAEKICHLTAAMQNKESRELVQRAAGSTDIYAEVVDELRKRYDKCKVVYLHHVGRILSRGAVHYTRKSLRDSLEFIRRHKQGLERNQGHTLEQFLAAFMELRMDDECKSHWGVFSAKSKPPPTLEHLCEFLEERMDTLPEESSTLSKRVHKPNAPSFKNTSAKGQDSSRPTVFQAREKSLEECPVCGDRSHYIYHCSAFRGLKVDRRSAVARQHKLCYNCLSPGHNRQTCPSKRTCKECNRKHHTLLHKLSETTEPPTEPIADSSALLTSHKKASMPRTVIIPRTALATVTAGPYSQKARAQLDPGATITLVTTRLAQALKAKPIPCHTDITGVGGDKTSRCQVDLRLSSAFSSGGESIRVRAHVVDHITDGYHPQDLEEIRRMHFLKGLQLADPEFDRSGRIDVLLGIVACNECTHDEVVSSSNRRFKAHKTIFGWAVGGERPSASAQETSTICMKASAKEDPTHTLLKEFWKLEEVPGYDSHFTPEESQAMESFKDSVQRDPDGRYRVKLPRRDPVPELGNSREMAHKRFLQNERSLMKKGKWSAFSAAVQEYGDLGHSEVVPDTDLDKPSSQVFYLPMHGVVKDSSTTTKLRIVFDASAKSMSGISLNDCLLPGPSLYPLLTSVLLRFRMHLIGMSADIGKMFREVGLHQDERDFHRFLMRDEQGHLQDRRMTRLTFGVTSSPFLATQVLRQVATDHQNEFPRAAPVVLTTFYVDDCLTGTDTLEDAVDLREELNTLLSKAKMTLRKWRTSSTELLQTIPEELRETDQHQVISAPADCHKALGIHWSTQDDTLHIATPRLDSGDAPTKRQLASDVARTFDVMGWFAPATIKAKIMLQCLWNLKLGWDDTVPDDLTKEWQAWRTELPELTNHPLPRCYFHVNKKKHSLQLHGFADASQVAYGGVVYLRTVYQDTTTDVTLVMAKSRVAPLNHTTIPRLELCGALTLSKLLDVIRKELQIPLDQTFAWTDSAIIIGWLNTPVTKLKTFVANRVEDIRSKIPATHWRHVPTRSNPADLVSRGVQPKDLLQTEIWWKGPPWLSEQPGCWPQRPDINPVRDLPDIKQKVLITKLTEEEFGTNFSTMTRLLTVTAWMLRFIHNTRSQTKIKKKWLDFTEIQQARNRLYLLSQKWSFPKELKTLEKEQELLRQSSILHLHPFLDKDGLLRVGGRLGNTNWDYTVKHPLILSRKSHITRLLLDEVHLQNQHPGPSTMMAILAQSYHIPGVKRLVKKLSRLCVKCQRVYAKASNQLMGNLPADRVTPAPPFNITGIDFAGPFLCKRGNPRKPTLVKTYICLFICFTTKAVHLEVVSDLTTESFLAAFRRFTCRRGCPAKIYSDNGSNFVGANRELKEVYKLLQSQAIQKGLIHLSSIKQMEWCFSPSRAPHFGGLWESEVKNMKRLMRKIVGIHQLTFEELNTVAAEAEATLNSRPLLPVDSLPDDGVPVLTPGHFLIGRPLRSPPVRTDADPHISTLKRWNLCLKLSSELWKQWSSEYLQSLQKRAKWKKSVDNVKVGDVVLVKDEELYQRAWPLATVERTFPGADGHVRVAEVRIGQKIYTRPIHKMVPLLWEDTSSSRREDVQASKAFMQEETGLQGVKHLNI